MPAPFIKRPHIIHDAGNSWTFHGQIRCVCGHGHYLEATDSKCDNCGAIYNTFGQHLLTPSQWETTY